MKKTINLAILLLIIFITSCDSNDSIPTSVAIVTGVHSNSKLIPTNTESTSDLLTTTAKSYGTISVIMCDGDPFLATSLDIPKPSKNGLSSKKLNDIAISQTNQILSLLSSLKAKSAEVDTLKAINLATRALNTNDNEQKLMLIFDTGLSTTGLLSFQNNILDVSPVDITNKLNELSAIPDLSGIDIVWTGLGEVDYPQSELSNKEREQLKEIWNSILLSGNAKSVTFKNDFTSESIGIENLPTVSTIQLAPSTFIQGTIMQPEILDETKFAFKGDSSEFIDKEHAISILKPIAEKIISNDSHILLAGTTATLLNKDEYCTQLSEKRALAVKNVLIDLGVNPLNISVIGLGYENEWHINDIDANGIQNETYARQNRKVLLFDINSTEAKNLLNK